MLGSGSLEIATGIVFVYLLLSLICTSVMEAISSFLNKRGSTLFEGVKNLLNDPSFTGGLAGQVGGVGIAPDVPGSAVDATVNANHSFQTIFSSGGAPCAGIQPGAPTCPLAVSLNTFPTGALKTPYYYQFNSGVEQQVGARGNLRGTAGWNCRREYSHFNRCIQGSRASAGVCGFGAWS